MKSTYGRSFSRFRRGRELQKVAIAAILAFKSSPKVTTGAQVDGGRLGRHGSELISVLEEKLFQSSIHSRRNQIKKKSHFHLTEPSWSSSGYLIRVKGRSACQSAFGARSRRQRMTRRKKIMLETLSAAASFTHTIHTNSSQCFYF